MNHNLNKEKIVFIINPASGVRKKSHIPYLIRKHIDHTTFEPQIFTSEFKGEATEISKKVLKEGIRKIVAVGGDGTVNEVAKTLVDCNAVLGIIPIGSGNGLARHLKIPLKINKAIEVINVQKTIKIDYGLINNLHFFCICGVGFDAHIGNKFAESDKRGLSIYVKTSISEILNYKPEKYRLEIDGKKIKKKAFLITVANASQYGGNAYISPGADIQDGLLDICIVSPFPKIRAFDIGFRLFSKTMNKSKFVEVIKSKELIIKREKAGEINFDGDTCIMKKELKIKIIPEGLKVMVP